MRPDISELEGFSASARLRIAADQRGQFLAVQRRVEGEPGEGSVWRHVSRIYLPREVAIRGYALDEARLHPGGQVTPLDDDGIELLCEPTGSCGPATIYLEGSRSDRSRIAILPFAGAPIVMSDW